MKIKLKLRKENVKYLALVTVLFALVTSLTSPFSFFTEPSISFLPTISLILWSFAFLLLTIGVCHFLWMVDILRLPSIATGLMTIAVLSVISVIALLCIVSPVNAEIINIPNESLIVSILSSPILALLMSIGFMLFLPADNSEVEGTVER